MGIVAELPALRIATVYSSPAGIETARRGRLKSSDIIWPPWMADDSAASWLWSASASAGHH